MSSPAAPFTHQLLLSQHLERVRRLTAPCREGLLIRDLRGGWLTRQIGEPPGDFPSSSQDRAFWLTLNRKLEPSDLHQARNIATSVGIQRLFLWLAPWASDASTDAMLANAGAARCPHVHYIAFSRPAAEPPIPASPPQDSLPPASTPPSTPASPAAPVPPAHQPTTLQAEHVDPALAPDMLVLCEHWYGKPGIATALRMLETGSVEVHMAFDGPQPVALGMLTLDGDWAYLSAAATDPAHRARGAQSALIRSRLRSAAARGVSWCSCETNTAVPISYRNLKRCGFNEAIAWHVYRWDLQPFPA